MKILIVFSLLSIVCIDTASHSKYILIKKENDSIDSLVITEKGGVIGSTKAKELNISSSGMSLHIFCKLPLLSLVNP